MQARKLRRPAKRTDSNIEKVLDLGFVGEPQVINPHVLQILEDSDFIPVIAPIGADRNGQTYNINADTVAGAIAAALGWLLQEGGGGSVVIRADSQYALNIANGEWKAKKNRNLASHVRALWDEVSSLRELTGEHVRAHRGHRWYERADHLAFRAMSGKDPLPLQFWKPGRR